MGVAGTIAGDGDGLFFFSFLRNAAVTIPAEGTKRPGPFSVGNCESCTRTIYTIPGSMKVGEYGLTRGTCVVASCLEGVAVAGMLWISWV